MKSKAYYSNKLRLSSITTGVQEWWLYMKVVISMGRVYIIIYNKEANNQSCRFLIAIRYVNFFSLIIIVFNVLLNKIFVANTTHNKDLQDLQFTCWRNFWASVWRQHFCMKKNYLIDFSFGWILKFIYKRAEKIRGGGRPVQNRA